MKYAVLTFGCRVNQADSLGFEEGLLGMGAQAVPAEAADVVVVNTCSVTASADQGARQAIRRLARLNPSARIVVTGCYATREPADVAALPGVAHVACNDDKPQLLTVMRSLASRVGPAGLGVSASEPALPSTAARFADGDGACGASLEPGVAGRTAFTLRVQTGCAEACSYCIIPATRGAPRSETLAALVAEAHRVVRAGFREIALTGVHLGSYGRDLEPRTSLASLLRALDAEFGASAEAGAPAVRFRVSSLEPMDCTPDVLTLMRDSACLAPHFHLPLQHASGRMLEAMRRPYDLAYYAALVDAIRRDLPHASIGTDVIVGFPGEQDEDFAELEHYLEGAPLTHVHVFPYSDRPGTAASRLGNRPDGVTIKARGARLRAVSARLQQRFLRSQLGTVHRALTLEDGTLAVTGNYLKLRIAPGLTRNRWVRAGVTEVGPSLRGEVLAVEPEPTAR